MKLPNLEQAAISEAKIVDYLLSFTHSSGRGKAQFFTRFGFSLEDWHTLATSLIVHATEHEVMKVESNPFGMRYVIEGVLRTPVGRTPMLRSVWFIDSGESDPRFVTAYPMEEGESDD